MSRCLKTKVGSFKDYKYRKNTFSFRVKRRKKYKTIKVVLENNKRNVMKKIKKIFITILALSFYACEPDPVVQEPETTSEPSASHPYCYLENGKTVCYKYAK